VGAADLNLAVEELDRVEGKQRTESLAVRRLDD